MSHPLPIGFRYSGVACGLKASGKADLALIVADKPIATAGVYTQNIVHAASIDWNRRLTPSAHIRAVVVNSGNANACTGPQGVDDNREMAQLTAEAIDAEVSEVLVLSTGIIGHCLPMNPIVDGISLAAGQLDADSAAFEKASRAITTTDQSSKTAARQFATPHGTITITGMAKGAGMIGPNMATLLSVITTDADVNASDLDRILREVVDQTFNCISVDGHTSTNDAVIVMASGEIPLDDALLDSFRDALLEVCESLAKMIPADGEGASHLIELMINGAASDRDARIIAKTIASSPLVKTAITGNDPNWGRIVSAAGYAGVAFAPQNTSLRVNGELIFSQGAPCEFDEDGVSHSMAQSLEVFIELELGEGPGTARFWTSDLTVDYVQFNSDYRT